MRARLNPGFLPWLLATAMCGSFLFAQSSNISEESLSPTYHSTVSEVRLLFFATDEHNHPVEPLQKDDFAVVDDERVIRDFRSFSRAESVKLDVVVLIDSSESALPHLEQEIQNVEQLISQWPMGPEDKLSVLSFGGTETHLVCARDCRSSFIPYRLSSVPKGGTTPLFDALEIATGMLVERKRPDVLPVVILFSDGEDTISNTSFRGVLRKAVESEAQIYAVDLGGPGRRSNGAATLQKIADVSGGRRVPISENSANIFNEVIEDLHSARVVTYAPPDSTSEFHSIRILPTHNLKLQFRCRRGYYRPAGSNQLEDRP